MQAADTATAGLAAVTVAAIRLLDMPWGRTICAILGWAQLLAVYLIRKRCKRDAAQVKGMERAGLIFLFGTPSYKRTYDIALLSGVICAFFGVPQVLPPFAALYNALGVSEIGIHPAVVTFKTAVALVIAMGFQNPLVSTT
jgi:hypothetical protein